MHKILGYLVGQIFKMGKHINEVCEKAQKYLSLLKVLAGSGWGVHPLHLRRLYIALIRSRIDYGSFLYDNAATCHISKLDKLQNQALRVIGGFIKTTPIHVMESELCLPPLTLRRQYLAYKFCLKSHSWSNNETIKLLGDLSVSHNWRQKKIPLLLSSFNETKDEIISCCNTLHMFTLNTWVANIDIKNSVKTSLDSIKNSKLLYERNLLKSNVVQELRTNYNGWYAIYTDGSKTDKSSGAAFYDPNNGYFEIFNLTCNISIMTAELIALSKALTYASGLGIQKIVILTDSKSSLQHVTRCASGHRGISIAYEVLDQVNNFKINNIALTMQWVPAHIGLYGNEEADHLAKRALVEGFPLNVQPNYSEILGKYKLKNFVKWREYFDERSTTKGIWYKSIQSEPPRIPWFLCARLGRKQIIVAHRMRSGHIPSNKFAFLMRKVNSPNCEVCGKEEDLYHLLLECVRYAPKRNMIIQTLQLNVTDVGVFHNILAEPTSGAARMLYSLLM